MGEENTSASTSIPNNIPIINSNPLREDFIATAVKFLQNPKVQTSPLQQKKDFMKRKGLSEEEIEKAIKLAGISETSVSPSSNHGITLPTSHSSAVAKEPVSGWSKLRDYSSFAILVAGIVYGIYSLYKRFIEPVFVRHQKQQTEKLNLMEKELSDLNSNVTRNLKELQSAMTALQTQFTDQNIKLATMSSNLTDYQENSFSEGPKNSLSILQAEVTSLKALLLGTKQFPSTPSVPPVIPSWQMKPPAGAHSLNPEPIGDEPKPVPVLSVQSSGDEKKPETIEASPVVPRTISKSDLEQDLCDTSGLNANDKTSLEGTVGSDSPKTNLSDNFLNMNGHSSQPSPLKTNQNSGFNDSNILENGDADFD